LNGLICSIKLDGELVATVGQWICKQTGFEWFEWFGRKKEKLYFEGMELKPLNANINLFHG